MWPKIYSIKFISQLYGELNSTLSPLYKKYYFANALVCEERLSMNTYVYSNSMPYS